MHSADASPVPADRPPVAAGAPAATPLRGPVENLPFVVVRLDGTGTLRYVGPGGEALTGYPADTLVEPRFALRLVHPEDRHRLTAALRSVEGGATEAGRLRLVRADGAVRVVDYHFTAGREGGIEGVVFDAAGRDRPGAFSHEALYQAFLEQSPVGIVYLDADGVVTFESHRARRITGEAASGSWLGRRLADLGGLDGRLAPRLERMLGSGQAFDAREVDYTRPDGTVVRLRVVGSPILEPEAGLVGGVLMLLDVTAEHERAEALRVRARYDAAEPALRNAALATADGLTFLEAAVALVGRTAEADRARVMLAVSDGEPLVPVTLWTGGEPVVPEPIELDLAAWPALANGRVVTVGPDDGAAARSLLSTSGTTALALAPFHADGDCLGVFLLERLGEGAAWNTAEARALGRFTGLFETLWAWVGAEARYRQTVADLEDGLFSFAYDLEGVRRYALVTPRFEALTGCPSERLLAADGAVGWTDLVYGEDREAFEAHEDALRAGDPSRLIYRIRRPDTGEVRWIRESATPSRSPSGRPVVGGLISDVTDQKRAELSLLEAKQAAERASHLKTTFMTTMSHEIRSPLGSVRGFAELLAEEVRDLVATGVEVPPQVEEFAGIVEQNTRRALHLVHNLFDLSRLETGSLPLQHVPVALRPAVEAAVRRHAPDAEWKDLPLRVEYAEGDPAVMGDPERVEQVFDHLLSNAIKFTEAGEVTVRTAVEGGCVRCVVEDTGIGIAPEYLDGLFEPFSQEDYRLNRKYGGSGLGLAITKRLLDAMGGTIEVETEKGKGSRFTVTFERAGMDAER